MLSLEMGTYYSLWKSARNKFGEPVFYDYSFPVGFPNIVFSAKSPQDAKAKIKAINNRIGTIDRFDPRFPKMDSKRPVLNAS